MTMHDVDKNTNARSVVNRPVRQRERQNLRSDDIQEENRDLASGFKKGDEANDSRCISEREYSAKYPRNHQTIRAAAKFFHLFRPKPNPISAALAEGRWAWRSCPTIPTWVMSQFRLSLTDP